MKRAKKIFGEILHAVLSYLRRFDKFLFLMVSACSIYGVVLIKSAVSGYSNSRSVLIQNIAIIAGIAAMVIISLINYDVLCHIWKIIGVFCICLLVVTMLIGTGREGADDMAWIAIGPITIQPSEFVKLGFSVVFAAVASNFKDNISSPLSVAILCLIAAVPVGFIILQKDLGSAIIFLIMFVAMLYAAGVRALYFVIAGVAAIIAAPIVWFKVLSEFHRTRVLIAFTPEVDPLNYGYQQYYGRLAIGSGGLTGLGLGQGIQTQSGFISEARNDYIFAVAGEELGFLGATAIIILLTIIIVRIFLIGFSSNNLSGRIICVGIASMFASQMVINIGMCLCLMPVIGVTLPFFSSGGSSMLACFMAIGLAEGVRIQNQPVISMTGEEIKPVRNIFGFDNTSNIRKKRKTKKFKI